MVSVCTLIYLYAREGDCESGGLCNQLGIFG
jgi:hypothetical protein